MKKSNSSSNKLELKEDESNNTNFESEQNLNNRLEKIIFELNSAKKLEKESILKCESRIKTQEKELASFEEKINSFESLKKI